VSASTETRTKDEKGQVHTRLCATSSSTDTVVKESAASASRNVIIVASRSPAHDAYLQKAALASNRNLCFEDSLASAGASDLTSAVLVVDEKDASGYTKEGWYVNQDRGVNVPYLMRQGCKASPLSLPLTYYYISNSPSPPSNLLTHYNTHYNPHIHHYTHRYDVRERNRGSSMPYSIFVIFSDREDDDRALDTEFNGARRGCRYDYYAGACHLYIS